jgi:hypothetical protein
VTSRSKPTPATPAPFLARKVLLSFFRRTAMARPPSRSLIRTTSRHEALVDQPCNHGATHGAITSSSAVMPHAAERRGAVGGYDGFWLPIPTTNKPSGAPAMLAIFHAPDGAVKTENSHSRLAMRRGGSFCLQRRRSDLFEQHGPVRAGIALACRAACRVLSYPATAA